MSEQSGVEHRHSVDIVNTEPYIKVRANYMRIKQELAVAQTKLIEAEKARDAAVAEATSAKSRYDENKLKAENADLRGQLRTVAHRRAHDRLAKEKGFAEDSLDLLWQASGWKADKDEVDEAAMAAHLEEVTARPGVARLRGGAADLPTQPATPAPGRGQGARDIANGKMQVTQQQLGDPFWAYEHRTQVAEALKNKTLEILD